MRFVARFGLLVLVVAAAEVVLLVVAARKIGLPLTLGLTIATSVLGAVLLRREGARGWRRFRTALAERRPPGAEVSDGLIGVIAAFLLFVPGFVTDVIGLVLLTPPARALARDDVRRRTERRISAAAAGDLFGPRRVRPTNRPTPHQPAGPPNGTTPTDSDVVEGEVVEGEIVDPDRRP